MPISIVPRATLFTLLALETIRQEVEDTGAAMAADCLGVAVLVGAKGDGEMIQDREKESRRSRIYLFFSECFCTEVLRIFIVR